MQRIYGTAYFSQEELDAWIKQREEAEKRESSSTGARTRSLFDSGRVWTRTGLLASKGGIVRQQMDDYLREELVKRNYSFVYTPHIAKRELWQLSGHEQNYGDAMFAPTKLEETEFRLKADELPDAYRHLQVAAALVPRSASALRRNGHGLSRGIIRHIARIDARARFTVDDAHLFCTPEQIPAESMPASILPIKC